MALSLRSTAGESALRDGSTLRSPVIVYGRFDFNNSPSNLTKFPKPPLRRAAA